MHCLPPAEKEFLDILSQVAECLVTGNALMVAALRKRADQIWKCVVDGEEVPGETRH
jgi:hypothetical protein